MSERYTSGSVGRFGFPEANAALEAADAMVGRFSDEGREMRVDLPRPIVARLTQDLGDIEFDASPINYRFRLWNWEQVIVTASGARRAIVTQNGIKKSANFGDYPRGRAVMLNGSSRVGEMVVLFRLMQNNGTPFFAFNGTVHEPAPVSLLKISTDEPPVLESLPNAPKRWRYTVEPIWYDNQLRPDLPNGIAYNLYETSLYRKQPVEFTNPNSNLEVGGPIDGRVFGTLATRKDQSPAIWVFESVLPMAPVCEDGNGEL